MMFGAHPASGPQSVNVTLGRFKSRGNLASKEGDFSNFTRDFCSFPASQVLIKAGVFTFSGVTEMEPIYRSFVWRGLVKKGTGTNYLYKMAVIAFIKYEGAF